MQLPRASGILLHITSLPGGPLSGDLGPSAYEFVDFLADAGQSWWQMLPLNPIDAGGSPYSSVSSFAGEASLISPELLWQDGLLRKGLLTNAPLKSTTWRSNLARSKKLRSNFLAHAHRGLQERNKASTRQALEAFKVRERDWLEAYCLFAALSDHFGTSDWTRWPHELARRSKASVRSACADLRDEIDFLAFQQFVFDRQWRSLKTYAADKGVRIIGDIPMFVAHQSCDVWANRRSFSLTTGGRPKFVAGAPPDHFNANGQRWGNPVFDWGHQQQTGFAWWKQRVKRQLDLFDVARLDHFIGFSRYWRIPGRARTAKRGRWVPARGQALFDELVRAHGELPFIAEDLGAVTQEVWGLRDRYRFPGMKVLQFAFGGGEGARVHRPHDYPRSCVAFTGTHDNNTTLGWYRALKRLARSKDEPARAELRRVRAYFGTDKDEEVVRAAIRSVATSPAELTIFPLQDVLGLDARHRMNEPGTMQGNWRWRLRAGQLKRDVSRQLRELAEATDRLPKG